MTPAERAKHALKNDWQEAYVEEKIRDLVKALNRPALGLRTIAACEGHAYGFHSPYVYFQAPPHIAGMLEKRLLLALVRRDGLNYQWSLEGRFNGEFELCFALRSRELGEIHFHGSAFSRFWAYRLQRRKIDEDLALLALMIEELFDGDELPRIEDIPNPYDGDNHREEERKNPLFEFFGFFNSFRLGLVAKRIGVVANGARFLGCFGKFGRALNTRLQHKGSPKTGANRCCSRDFTSLSVVWRICNGVKNCSAHYTFIAILLLGLIAIGLAAGVHASDDGRVRAELIYVIDGDTFRAHVEGVRSPDWLSASDRLGHRIRVAEIDTPELKGKCEREKQLAILAKDAAAALLKAGRTIELTDLRPDKYGRIVASVWIDGQNLGAELLRQGLARAFYVWPRREWCLNGD